MALEPLHDRETPNQARLLLRQLETMSEAERKEISGQLAGVLGQPTRRMRDRVWWVVVSAFCVVLVGAFGTLALGVFRPAGGKVEPELVLAMFTSVVGFLSGLFVPSPLSGAKSNE